MQTLATPMIPVPTGELFDKLTILRIKLDRVKDPAKLANVSREYTQLVNATEQLMRPTDQKTREKLVPLITRLGYINTQLWDMEDKVRTYSDKCFDLAYVNTARDIFHFNDQRAMTKREINITAGSILVEEKAYSKPSGQ